MLVSKNGEIAVREIPTIIIGKDKRGRTLLLQINIVRV
jgi:hypothetical protein